MKPKPPKSVEERAHAKVNLHLEVIGRREDGYHDLITVMHEIDLADELSLTEDAAGVRLECDDSSLDCGESNLILRAHRVVEDHVGHELSCRYVLRKRIPTGGGLGGGSSDAAAAVRGLDRLFDLRLPTPTMESLLARIGSDTAFFVRGGTALCEGRGEIVHPRPLAHPLNLVLVLPGFSVPTGPVFGALRLTGLSRRGYDLLWCLETGDVRGVANRLFNRLEPAARRVESRLDATLNSLARWGCVLSGSGSTAFAVVSSREEAVKTAEIISRTTGLDARAAESARRPGASE